MEVAEPKCPECGKHDFVYRFVLSENDYAKGRTKTKIGPFVKTPFAIAFCASCGHIIGVAGM